MLRSSSARLRVKLPPCTCRSPAVTASISRSFGSSSTPFLLFASSRPSASLLSDRILAIRSATADGALDVVAAKTSMQMDGQSTKKTASSEERREARIFGGETQGKHAYDVAEPTSQTAATVIRPLDSWPEAVATGQATNESTGLSASTDASVLQNKLDALQMPTPDMIMVGARGANRNRPPMQSSQKQSNQQMDPSVAAAAPSPSSSSSPSPTASTHSSFRRSRRAYAPRTAATLPPIRDISTYPSRLSSASISFDPVPSQYDVPIATLAHGLDRVLFNPGVHWVRDPRSRVYNFPRSLESIPAASEFDFSKLPEYITSSKDEQLKGLADKWDRTFVSSTSSTTGMLCQIYFWLSKGKGVDLSRLSAVWQAEPNSFSAGQQLPQSVIMHEKDGRYSIDADKSMDASISTNILASLGHLMEKLLTSDTSEFSRFLLDSKDPIPTQADIKQAYHFTKTDHMILRSQLDATNPHLPNQTFDVKTRGVVAVRQDRLNWEEHGGYLIQKLLGREQSFEKEFYDLYRSAYLKYQFQARIGHMDGILVAFHNTARLFGFSYVPISDMDEVLFGSAEEGEQAYKLCVGFLEKILLAAKDCYPNESVKATFDATGGKLSIFVEPVAALPEGSSLPPITLLELDGSNYVDGVGQHLVNIKLSIEQKATSNRISNRESAMIEAAIARAESYSESIIPSSDDIPEDLTPATPSTSNIASDIPIWEVGYSLTRHLGDAVPSEATILARFGETRARQTMFDTLNLPTGVSRAELEAAIARVAANEEGAVLDPSDLTVRFPASEGMTYVSKVPAGVNRMRSLARKGRRQLDAEEMLEIARAEQLGEARSFIQGSTSFSSERI